MSADDFKARGWMIVATITVVVGTLLLKETHGHKIWDEVGGPVASAR